MIEDKESKNKKRKLNEVLGEKEQKPITKKKRDLLDLSSNISGLRVREQKIPFAKFKDNSIPLRLNPSMFN